MVKPSWETWLAVLVWLLVWPLGVPFGKLVNVAVERGHVLEKPFVIDWAFGKSD